MATTSALGKVFDGVFGRRRRLRDTRSVLLTFDDGPHPEITPIVLERLRTFQARAVFFVVGSRIERARGLLPEILAQGHIIGNHSFEHRLERDPGLISYVADVRRCQALLTSLTGVTPGLFRAPMGRNTGGALLTPRVLGLRQILWSVDSRDWELRAEKEAVMCGEKLCGTVRGGDIVLLHDDNRWTVKVLDILLPSLSSRGFDLQHGINSL